MLPSVPDHWYAISDVSKSFKEADVYCDNTYDGATAATVRSAANDADLTAAARSFYGSNVAFWLAYAIEAGELRGIKQIQLGKRANARVQPCGCHHLVGWHQGELLMGPARTNAPCTPQGQGKAPLRSWSVLSPEAASPALARCRCARPPANCRHRADSPANHQAGKTYYRNFHFWSSGMVYGYGDYYNGEGPAERHCTLHPCLMLLEF